MSRELNPSQIWSQLPVASRTVEVNTKTGFSLTAGSYSIHATSNQRGSADLATSNQTITISSVTITRATCTGQTYSNVDNYRSVAEAHIASATTVSANSYFTGSSVVMSARWEVEELF